MKLVSDVEKAKGFTQEFLQESHVLALFLALWSLSIAHEEVFEVLDRAFFQSHALDQRSEVSKLVQRLFGVLQFLLQVSNRNIQSKLSFICQ